MGCAVIRKGLSRGMVVSELGDAVDRVRRAPSQFSPVDCVMAARLGGCGGQEEISASETMDSLVDRDLGVQLSVRSCSSSEIVCSCPTGLVDHCRCDGD